MNKVMAVKNDKGISFNIRIVSKGDKYGLNGMYEHNEDMEYLEFYDSRYNHTILGQFVARYYIDTISNCTNGISLYSSVPEWYVSKQNIVDIQRLIAEYLKDKNNM